MKRKFFIPGKWILLGEHAAVRGKPAIAYPHRDLGLTFEFEFFEDDSPLEIDSPWNEAVEKVVEKIGIEFNGKLKITANLPAKAGFGSSAALCVGMYQLATEVGLLKVSTREFRELATQAESLFHGKSSGLDIAAVMSRTPIWFQKGEEPKSIDFAKPFNFTFHDTGSRSETKASIATVEKLFKNDPELVKTIDQRMEVATFHAVQALKSGNPKILAHSLNQAQSCFDDWGLTHPDHKTMMDGLKSQGALAVKYTGSGQGGFLVALWS